MSCFLCVNSTAVTLFRLNLNSGESIFSQVVFAAKKAVIGGEFLAGQAFPSVRTLAAELKIHPNTAHKAIQYLIQERLLENRARRGDRRGDASGGSRRGQENVCWKDEVQRLVVEAKRVGLQMEEVIEAIEGEWESLERPQEARRK